MLSAHKYFRDQVNCRAKKGNQTLFQALYRILKTVLLGPLSHIPKTYNICQEPGNSAMWMWRFSVWILCASSRPSSCTAWVVEWLRRSRIFIKASSGPVCICVCKGLVSFSINIMAGLATFSCSVNNLRGGESGWSISSVCLLRGRLTLIL